MDINSKLGFSVNDVILVPHANDMGMCRATNHACLSLLKNKAVTSASVMVPCPGFDEVVEMSKANSGLSLGVQLTLTADGGDDACWSPLTDSSVVDSTGLFYTDPYLFFKQAKIKDIEQECCAQIERMFDAGINITHLTSHKNIMLQGSLITLFARLALKYGIPCVMPIVPVYDTYKQRHYIQAIKFLKSCQWPGFFNISSDYHPDAASDGFASFTKRMQELKSGVNLWLVHPADLSLCDSKAVFDYPKERETAYNLYKEHLTYDWSNTFFHSAVDEVVSMQELKQACISHKV
mgnify:CR=1 FL=1